MATVAMAGEKPELKMLDKGIKLDPIRVAPAAMINGKWMRTGKWQAYKSDTTRQCVTNELYDGAETNPTTGVPEGGTTCGIGSGSRWFFGTAYLNPFATNDMTVDAGNEAAFAERSDIAWYHGVTEALQLYILTTDQDITLSCTDVVTTAAGIIADFGVVPCGCGFYYYSNIDLCGTGLGYTMPGTDGDPSGSHLYIHTTDGVTLSTLNQPMLWGTGDDRPNPGPGTQDTQQYDDDAPTSGTHELPTECYTYSFGVCPDPLGSMVSFFGEGGGTTCYVDCNGDTVIDSTDFLCYLNLFVTGDPGADCNGDTVVDSTDFLCFLNLFVNPPCP